MKIRSISIDDLIEVSEVKEKTCLAFTTEGTILLDDAGIEELLSAIDQLRPERKRL